MKPKSELEAHFRLAWKSVQQDKPETPDIIQGYKFHTKRKWEFDFAHVPSKVAIEIEGGMWGQGRHNRAEGYTKDCIKYNHAQMDGWIVYRISSLMFGDYPEFGNVWSHIFEINKLIQSRTP